VSTGGVVTERYFYDAYGHRYVIDAAGEVQYGAEGLQPYGFTGRRLDGESGLWYFRARYFDDQLGRFISRDPLGYVDGMSLYGGYFVPGGLDPSGLVDWWMLLEGVWDMTAGTAITAVGVVALGAPDPTLLTKVGGSYLTFEGSTRIGFGASHILLAFTGDSGDPHLQKARKVLPHSVTDATGRALTYAAGGNDDQAALVGQSAALVAGLAAGQTVKVDGLVALVGRADTLKSFTETTIQAVRVIKGGGDHSSSADGTVTISGVASDNNRSVGKETMNVKVNVHATVHCAAPFQPYRVKDKDCLWNIWRARMDKGIEWSEMLAANNFLANPDRIHPGWGICAPVLCSEPKPCP